ncbi:hypothetical protein DFH28DRAFT_932620 [Melampsora americana]|nr:hypothetical protein DFH28DRAFT_932620 [Melampsora americana]
MAKNKKRTKPRTENLNRRAISGLDARLLQMKRLSRARAEANTNLKLERDESPIPFNLPNDAPPSPSQNNIDMFIPRHQNAEMMQVKTKAWADPQLALHDWKLACNCRVQRRKLDVLDTLSRNQIELDFCSCTPNDQVRLLLAGYIGGSAQRPETAISIRLVRTFHTLWKWCILRYASFSEAWNEILDPAFPSFIHTQDKQVI